MPRSITVRDVPDDVSAELAARAARSGRSLQEYLKAHLIAFAAKPDIESWVADVRAAKAAMQAAVPSGRIIEYRDADRS